MFTQFFGGFLLSKGVVTPEQLVAAMNKQPSAHIQLGMLAMHAGLMTAEQIDEVKIAQTHTDKRFGEICVDKGFLTDAQVDKLLHDQFPSYLLLGQILEENGVFDKRTFQDLIHEYTSEHSIDEESIVIENSDAVKSIITDYCKDMDSSNKTFLIEYVQLLANNLIRFIGDDFTLLPPVKNHYKLTEKYSNQRITGPYQLTSIIDMSAETAISFASRYVSEKFDNFNEYVQASMEDFLNLHNGLFNVNISNYYSVELNLEAPASGESTEESNRDGSYLFSALYPFGTVNIIISEK